MAKEFSPPSLPQRLFLAKCRAKRSRCNLGDCVPRRCSVSENAGEAEAVSSVMFNSLLNSFRLYLLTVVAWLLCCDSFVAGLIALVMTYPVWEPIVFLFWPIRPNWRGQR